MAKDLISDMIARIKNAILVRHEIVVTNTSNMLIDIAKILKEEGYIEKFYLSKCQKGEYPYLIIVLRYVGIRKEPSLKFIKRVSKPGCRIYVNKKNLPMILSGYGMAIISTSKGLMASHQAKKLGLGGEVICQVW